MSTVKQKSNMTLFSKELVIALLLGIVQLGHSSTDDELFPKKSPLRIHGS